MCGEYGCVCVDQVWRDYSCLCSCLCVWVCGCVRVCGSMGVGVRVCLFACVCDVFFTEVLPVLLIFVSTSNS